MSCPMRDELLRADVGRRPALELHAAECAECSEALATLAEVKALLGDAPGRLTAVERARLWQRLEARAAEPTWWQGLFAARWAPVVASVAVVLVALALWPRADDLGLAVTSGELGAEAAHVVRGGLVPRGAVMTAAERTELAGRGLTIELMAGARLELDEVSPLAWVGGEPPLSLFLGAGSAGLSFVREPLTTLVVRTPLGRLETVAANVVIDVRAEESRFFVREGSARLVPNVGAPSELGPGEERRLVRTGVEGERAAGAGTARQPADRPAVAERASPAAGAEPGAAELARDADALRRGGRLEEAERAYAALAVLPSASGYAEEAELRRAQILSQLGRTDEALAALTTSGARFAAGPLAPERAVLAAEILVARGALLEGAAEVERVDDELCTEALQAKRVEIAAALLARDVARARRLAERVARAPTTKELRTAALRVAADAARRAGDVNGADALTRERTKLETP